MPSVRNRRTRKSKEQNGEVRDINKKSSFEKDWRLDDFIPEGLQNDIVESIDKKDLTIVDSPSGTGKSSTALFKSLKDYKDGKFNKVILIKNPTEAGDDKLGYLTGDKTDKLDAHMHTMKSIFYQFMTKEKLECDIRNGNIILDIPNFMLGATIDHSIIILEEAQTMSPDTIKLCAERAGIGSKVVILGDSKQRYAVKKRDDGLADLIDRITYDDGSGIIQSKFPNVGYIKMDHSHNKRSELSRFITEIYQ